MRGKYNSLHKQDKPSLLVQNHDSLKIFYEGQMPSMSKLLRIASTVCAGGGEGNNQYPYTFTRKCVSIVFQSGFTTSQEFHT